MVKAWATDTTAGHDTLMLAWRRDTVTALNRFARHQAQEMGRLHGDDLHAPGGRAYAQGDQVVTLAPNYQGDLVTSQRGTITAVDHHNQALTLTTDNHRTVTLTGEQIDADHLDHGYALTVHRTQGATTDRTHYLQEGGGRELAYVALSRARHATTIHTVADNLDQAIDDLTHQWNQPAAQDWITHTHQPTPDITDDLDQLIADLDRINQHLDTGQRHRPAPTHNTGIDHTPPPQPDIGFGL